ncbi:MAG: response regulator [Algicola sp.]|nr:response regulator [Algicola sp.]
MSYKYRLKKRNKFSGQLLRLSAIFFLAINLLYSPFITAANPTLRFDRISVEQGLSQSTIHCVLQDSKGFLWVGTMDGLSRYDGFTFKTYRNDPNDVKSISGNGISALLEDRQGYLWVATGNGLNRFDPELEQFERYGHDDSNRFSLSHDSVFALAEDRQGFLWVGTPNGLNRLDPQRKHFILYSQDEADPHGISLITSLLEDSQGNLWIGTLKGLHHFNQQQDLFTFYGFNEADPNSLSHNTVFSLVEDPQGTIWIGTGGGLNRFDPRKAQFVRYKHSDTNPYSLSHDRVHTLLIDRQGVLWVATSEGLNWFDSKRERFVHYKHSDTDLHSLSGDHIETIYEDRQGTIWVGVHNGGLNRLVSQSKFFGHYRHDPADPDSISDNDIRVFLEDRHGMFWFGTKNGLHRFDQKRQQFVSYRHSDTDPFSLSNDYVTALIEDHKGFIWVGTAGGGVNQFDPDRERFVGFRHDKSNLHSLSHDIVTSLVEDLQGMIWVGTGRGLNRFDPSHERFSRYQHDKADPNSLSSNFVMSLLEDRQGRIWVGTWGGGLNYYDPPRGKFTSYQHSNTDPHSLSNNYIYAIQEDRQGGIWIGSNGGGVNKLNQANSSFVHYRQKDGLANDVVYGILEDDKGFLWMSTNMGLSKFDPTSQQFKNYITEDGLQSNEFNKGAYLKSRNGELFFGGINGFNRFFPDLIKDDQQAPAIVFTDFLLFNQSAPIGGPKKNDLVTLDLNQGEYAKVTQRKFVLAKEINAIEELTLSYEQSLFSFEFAALHFASPKRNQYAYKLAGWDKVWIYTNYQNRLASYTNIPAGDYVLRVKASNKDGVWNDTGASIRLSISPPPWKTWWAYTLYTVLFLAALIAWTKWRTASLIKRTIELEQVVAQRTQELRQRNADVHKLLKAKDTLLVNISHEFKTPLTVLYGAFEFIKNIAAKGNETLKATKLTQQVQHMMTLVDQLLQLSRLESTTEIKREPLSLSECLEHLIPMYDSAAKILNIEMRVSIGKELVVIAERESFAHVFSNLISNAIKYNKRDGSVEIYAYQEENQCVVVIKDSGIGIAPENQGQIFKRFGKLDIQADLDHQVMSTGLGLAIVKEAVEANLGQLDLQSEVGRGTTFTLRFPLSSETQNLVTQFADMSTMENIQVAERCKVEPVLQETDENKNTVLIIEDTFDMADYIVETLSNDFNTLIAINGEKGIELATEHLPDIIISDIMMPGLDGFDVLQILKKQQMTAHIPVVLLTAMSDIDARLKGFKLKADDYLNKPFSPDELRLRIKSKLEYRDILRSRFEMSEVVVAEQSMEEETQLATEVSLFDIDSIACDSKQAFILEINRWLDQHIDQQIKIPELASHLAMSNKQLGRKLKQITPFNAVEYIRSYRLVKAYDRLPNEPNIANLAYDLGFSSQGYFADVFKAYFGIRPRQRQQGMQAKKGILM